MPRSPNSQVNMWVASGEWEKKSQTLSGSWWLVKGSGFWEWMKSGNLSGSRMKKIGVLLPDQVVVAVLGVELDGEPARVADGVGRAPAAGHRGEPEEGLGLLADLAEEPGPGPPGHVGGYLEGAVGGRSVGMDHPLGDALAVEPGQLLEQVLVLEEDGPVGPAVWLRWLSTTGAPDSVVRVGLAIRYLQAGCRAALALPLRNTSNLRLIRVSSVNGTHRKAMLIDGQCEVEGSGKLQKGVGEVREPGSDRERLRPRPLEAVAGCAGGCGLCTAAARSPEWWGRRGPRAGCRRPGERSGHLAEGVGALAVPDLDGPAGGPGEQPVGGADLDAAAGGEHGPLQIGPVQPRQQ